MADKVLGYSDNDAVPGPRPGWFSRAYQYMNDWPSYRVREFREGMHSRIQMYKADCDSEKRNVQMLEADIAQMQAHLRATVAAYAQSRRDEDKIEVVSVMRDIRRAEDTKRQHHNLMLEARRRLADMRTLIRGTKMMERVETSRVAHERTAVSADESLSYAINELTMRYGISTRSEEASTRVAVRTLDHALQIVVPANVIAANEDEDTEIERLIREMGAAVAVVDTAATTTTTADAVETEEDAFADILRSVASA